MLTTTGPGLRLRTSIVIIRIIVTVIQTRIAIFIIADVQTFTISMLIISNLVFDNSDDYDDMMVTMMMMVMVVVVVVSVVVVSVVVVSVVMMTMMTTTTTMIERRLRWHCIFCES